MESRREQSDQGPEAGLVAAVYEQLRGIARQRMAGEHRGASHTLGATALVHEAFLRLAREGEGGAAVFANKAHFYFAAARAMQQILIDHARARSRFKRGGDRDRVPLSVVDLAEEADEIEILALDGALRRLESRDRRTAEVVRLRFFAGLSTLEVATTLGISERTVKREWQFARAWLFNELRGEGARPAGREGHGEGAAECDE